MGELIAGGLLEGLFYWQAAMCFIDPLRHRGKYPARAAVGFAVCVSAAILLAPLGQDMWAMPRRFLMWVVLTLLAGSCSKISALGAAYCAVLSTVAAQCVHELWMAVQGIVLEEGTLPWRRFWWVEVLFGSMVYLLVRFTAARWMPNNGRYDPSAMQLISAGLLALLFSLLFELLSQGLMVTAWQDNIVLPAVLGQFYCLTVLYLQNELFKKAAIQKELNTLNLLLDQQKRQYANARRSVQLINRRCHALKMEMAALRKAGGAPDTELEQAIDNYDGMIRTGNEVLNTVLTEKGLLCEERGIRLTCVADGTALDFLEAADLYGLFSITLDNAIEEVSAFADSDRRLVEVLVCRRQDFVVVNVSNPVYGKLTIEDGLPRARRATLLQGFGFKGVRRIVRRYDGMLNVDVNDGVLTVRVVIPVGETTL